MTPDTLKIKVQGLISDNKHIEVIALLWKEIKRDSPSFNTLTLISGRFRGAKTDYMHGTIDYETNKRDISSVSAALLELSGSLNIKDLAEVDSDKISTRLMLITPTDESEVEMRLFFPFEYFRAVEIAGDDDRYQSIIDDEDLIIFDNFAHQRVEVGEPIRKRQFEKLDWVLKNTACFIIWFGDYGEIVKLHNDRIYAANFRFALYARIREMLDFIKYYKGTSLTNS